MVKQESSSDRDIEKLQDFFFTISIDQAKTSTNRKCLTSNFHSENSRTWIFTLWKNIFQTQTLLLQLIHVYIYIYNIHHSHLHGWRKRLAMHLRVSQHFTRLQNKGIWQACDTLHKASKHRNMASLQDWNKLWC